MHFTDTHAHVYAEEFEADPVGFFERSMDKNVTRVFVPNIDLGSIQALKAICAKYSNNYFPMMGLHPCSVMLDYKQTLAVIYNELVSGKYYGIGEIGMDLYWDKTSFDIQKRAFIEQATWAIKLDLPVSIHSRNATSELIAIIKGENLGKLRGVFHCFSGDEAEAKELQRMGFFLGIGGVVTYKNSGLAQTLKTVGINKLVLETDAPYLPPVPHRGKLNETSFIPLIAEKISEIFNLPIEDVAEITTVNSKNIFGI